MKKKSILMAAIAVMLVAVLVVGGTLAYFTDTKSATNTFTVGNVKIDLIESKYHREGNDNSGDTDIPDPTNTASGMKYVTERSYVPVLADESVFSPADALKIMQMGAADMVNIKLMKCAGITNALKIASAAEVYGVECMIGCMLEAKISVTAAVHLACAKSIITKIDLDGPVLCKEDPIIGGAVFNEKLISLPNEPGLGIKGIEEGKIHYID